MDFDWTDEQRELRAQARKVAATAVERHGRHNDSWINGFSKDFAKEMAAHGWIGMTWPVEFGGGGQPPINRLIVGEELIAAGAPIAAMWFADRQMGPTLISYGTPDQQAEFLPGILSGETTWCIGMSEPNSGSDLASLTTSAVRDGEDFVVNGQKIWTSFGELADYCYLICRTDSEGPPHKGISEIIVPMDTPGITVQPLHLMGEHDINATFFDDVRVPAKYLVGEENGGWGLITNQLNHERVTLCSSGMAEGHYQAVRRWAQETTLPDGRRVIDQEWVQQNLARVHAKIEFLKLANWKVAWSAEESSLHPADASTVKVFGTEFYMENYRLLMEVIGPRAYLKGDAPEALLRSRLESGIRGSIILTFGGGTNELQRDLISMFGLGFPRAAR